MSKGFFPHSDFPQRNTDAILRKSQGNSQTFCSFLQRDAKGIQREYKGKYKGKHEGNVKETKGKKRKTKGTTENKGNKGRNEGKRRRTKENQRKTKKKTPLNFEL